MGCSFSLGENFTEVDDMDDKFDPEPEPEPELKYKPKMKVSQTRREEFLKQSMIKKAHTKQFLTFNNNNNNDNSVGTKQEIAKAEQLTKEVLSTKPSGDVSNRDTLLHILGSISGSAQGGSQQNCLFYDSSKCPSMVDADTSSHLIDAMAMGMGTQPKIPKLVVTFGSVFANTGKNVNNDDDSKAAEAADEEEVEIMIEMKQSIDSNISHPVLDDYRLKLSQAHGVRVNQIKITDVFAGTFNIKYEITHLTDNEICNMAGAQSKDKLNNKMKTLFTDYQGSKIHPLLYRQTYDIGMFDERGNKTFSEGSTYQVGPPGKQRPYIQPNGWIRYGLKVLGGKYGPNDSWLTPFQHPGNWYRAYHGTGNASMESMTSVDAMASIHNNAFRKAQNQLYGSGVYCSPDPVWDETYAGRQTLQTKQGPKNFMCLLQVAVNPSAVTFATDDIWVAKTPADIRPYGILIKEV